MATQQKNEPKQESYSVIVRPGSVKVENGWLILQFKPKNPGNEPYAARYAGNAEIGRMKDVFTRYAQEGILCNIRGYTTDKPEGPEFQIFFVGNESAVMLPRFEWKEAPTKKTVRRIDEHEKRVPGHTGGWD